MSHGPKCPHEHKEIDGSSTFEDRQGSAICSDSKDTRRHEKQLELPARRGLDVPVDLVSAGAKGAQR